MFMYLIKLDVQSLVISLKSIQTSGSLTMVNFNLQAAKSDRSDIFQQIQSLNSDRINIPQKKCIYHNLQLILIAFFQVAVFFYAYTYDNIDLFNCIAEWVVCGLIIVGCMFASFVCSDIKIHIDNIKNVEYLKEDYERIRHSTLTLQLSIECYHNQRSYRDRSSRKIVTHSAKKTINLSKCYDFSGQIDPYISNQFKKRYIFFDYNAQYQFLEQAEKIILQNMEKEFKDSNSRDTHQDYSKVFKFTDCEQRTRQGYILEGNSSSLNKVLAVTSALLLIWPVSMVLELFFVQRYEVKIVKKIKLEEDQQGYRAIDY